MDPKARRGGWPRGHPPACQVAPTGPPHSTPLLPGSANPVLAYAVGLGLTFGALAVTGKGQPALFYIVPSLLAVSFGTAAYRKEVKELLAFQGSRAIAAKEAREAWKQAQRAEQRRQEEE